MQTPITNLSELLSVAGKSRVSAEELTRLSERALRYHLGEGNVAKVVFRMGVIAKPAKRLPLSATDVVEDPIVIESSKVMWVQGIRKTTTSEELSILIRLKLRAAKINFHYVKYLTHTTFTIGEILPL